MMNYFWSTFLPVDNITPDYIAILIHSTQCLVLAAGRYNWTTCPLFQWLHQLLVISAIHLFSESSLGWKKEILLYWTKLSVEFIRQWHTQIAKFMGPTWAHLGPVGPRWAPCWPHDQGIGYCLPSHYLNRCNLLSPGASILLLSGASNRDYLNQQRVHLTAKFMGPTWGSSGADRTQVVLMLAPLTLLSGYSTEPW